MSEDITFFIDATAEEFYQWLVSYFQDEGPLEGFYDSLLFSAFFTWTPVEIMHDPVTEPNWWRYSVGVVADFTDYSMSTEEWNKLLSEFIRDCPGEAIHPEDNQAGITIEASPEIPFVTTEDGAFAFCMTQSKFNSLNPRGEVIMHWDKLFPGTAWKLLNHLAHAYPETQPTIDSWKKTLEGQQAEKAAATCEWWNTYISKPYHVFLRHTELADQKLTMNEFLEHYLKTEKGMVAAAAVRKPLMYLPEELRLWINKMLDYGQYRYDKTRYDNSTTLERRQKTKAWMQESWARIKDWYEPELKKALEPSPLPSSFEQWAREKGYTYNNDAGTFIETRESPPVGEVDQARISSQAEVCAEGDLQMSQRHSVEDKLREKQNMNVLLSVGDGLSNQEIAERLEIREGTVKNYVSELYALFELGRAFDMGDDESRERLSEIAQEWKAKGEKVTFRSHITK